MEQAVLGAFRSVSVVFLNGPRQAGKSTLVQHLAATELNADYATLDDITTLAAAGNDPEGFLRQFTKPLIVDEVQLAPGLFRAFKLLVDELRSRTEGSVNGRYLLTGSADVMALPGLADALVGRMTVLPLYPLSAVEVLGQGVPVINGLFDQDIAPARRVVGRRLQLAEIAGRATFPGISGAGEKSAATWFDGYLSALLQRDVRSLAEVEKITELPNIVKLLAARVSGLLNDADCARDAKLNAMTYRRYRILLERLFLIAQIPPWSRNIGKRLVKSPKLYFTDTALLCHQLGVGLGGLQRQNPGLFGRILENFVATELTKQVGMLGDGALFHFRSHDNREVDFVVERRNGTLIGIEVKASESVTVEDFAGLKALKAYAQNGFRRGIVFYRGTDVVPFADDMVALPLETLWTLDMNVTTDRDIRVLAKASGKAFEGVAFWADYGARTRVRCLIPRTVVDDHFYDGGSDKQAVAAVERNWDVVWPALVKKLEEGRIEIVQPEEAPAFRQVVLDPSDIEFRDFRR
ncbi:MAG: ATP-binding protein [Rhizomicrobium sp.]